MAGIVVEWHGAAGELLSAADERRQGSLVEAFEDEDLGAGEQRAVELEARVLRRGADQDHRAVLDVRQEAVLLGPVEAMDLVDEQQRALADGAPLLSRGEYLAQVGHPGEGRRDRLEDK